MEKRKWSLKHAKTLFTVKNGKQSKQRGYLESAL